MPYIISILSINSTLSIVQVNKSNIIHSMNVCVVIFYLLFTYALLTFDTSFLNVEFCRIKIFLVSMFYSYKYCLSACLL